MAQILADLGMGPLVVAAGLLHDTVEDTDYTLDECRAEFGDTVTGLVDGVTKLSKMEYGDSAQAETIRKMVVAMSRDVRVLVVKLSDRVHNARTWRYVKSSSAQKKARETLDVYAPLANRLGMNAIKTELEELSFKVLYPKIYNEIVVLVARRAGQRDVYLAQILAEINEDLDAQHIKAYVTGRPKDYFSIYQKMIVRGHDFANIYDLVGVRIIVDTIRDCYAALGAVHARWSPVPGRFKDYIAMPKLNMYQSLHTTVVGPGASRSRSRSAPGTCTGARNSASPRTGSTRRTGRRAAPEHARQIRSQTRFRRQPGAERGRQPQMDPAARRLDQRDPGLERVPWLAQGGSGRGRGLRVHPEARSSRCRPVPRRWTSPTPCIPKSGTGRWARASTAVWCRSTPSLRTATPSRC